MAGGTSRGTAQARTKGWRALPRTVWAFGLVSLFMDGSSELIHSLLPVFLVSTLGAAPAMLGLIEGAAEAVVAVVKVFSGWISDRLGRRKLLTLVGYGLAALSKPLFPLARSPFDVFAARLLDRTGKGIRGAPRDALIADVTPAEIRGLGFGVRQAMDTAGALIGPLAAMGLMFVLAGDIRAVFWWALVPAAACMLFLELGVDEPAGQGPRSTPFPLSGSAARALGRSFWLITAAAAIFTLARFSEAFLVLRASRLGLQIELTPLVLVVMNAVYALTAAPAGALSDRWGRRRPLALAIVVLIAADLVLAVASSPVMALVGAGLWGLHMGLGQGLLSALVADFAPAEARGTAFGLFNLVTGAATLAASALAGVLWQTAGPGATFAAGAAFALVSLLALPLLPRSPVRGA